MVFSREDVAWAAGFFDGEGGVYYYPNLKGTSRYTISARLSQKDPELLQKFVTVVRVGKIYGPYESSVCYTWAVYTFERVQHVIAMLWPFLGSAKRTQATVALRAKNGR